MNVKLLVGIVLFVIGLATAVVGIAGVGATDTEPAQVAVVEENRSLNLTPALGRMAIPFIAAFSLAVGGLLIGLSAGNWKNPHTNLKPGDEVVNPEGVRQDETRVGLASLGSVQNTQGLKFKTTSSSRHKPRVLHLAVWRLGILPPEAA
ncbi:MAG TPA: hypothetical protein VMO26_03930 [Vicinamibacterales bacterium]|nr:hypothetical protein [Vicinamibacterales bacterium]